MASQGLTKSQARHALSIARHLADILEPMARQMRSLSEEDVDSMVGWNRDVAIARFDKELNLDIAKLRRVVADMLPELSEE